MGRAPLRALHSFAAFAVQDFDRKVRQVKAKIAKRRLSRTKPHITKKEPVRRLPATEPYAAFAVAACMAVAGLTSAATIKPTTRKPMISSTTAARV